MTRNQAIEVYVARHHVHWRVAAASIDSFVDLGMLKLDVDGDHETVPQDGDHYGRLPHANEQVQS